jgi:hypothetical protein
MIKIEALVAIKEINKNDNNNMDITLIKNNPNDLGKLVSFLFHSRTQAHVYHLQTPSFTAHNALNAFYDGIIGLTDGLVESYQGKYGIITGYETYDLLEYNSCEEIIMFFQSLGNTVEKLRMTLPQDTYIQNQIDEIVALINSTIYKLKFLK